MSHDLLPTVHLVRQHVKQQAGMQQSWQCYADVSCKFDGMQLESLAPALVHYSIC